MTATKQTPCFCQAFEFGEFDGENESAVSYDTNCSQSTTRTFAQGHDAKLVGFLVRAELNGEEIRITEGGLSITFPGPVEAARRVSEALAAKTQAQLDAALARLAKKAAREAARTARKSAKAVEVAETPKDRDARIKVGRWTYDARIDGKTGWATYTKKLGGPVSIAPTDFTEV